MTEVQTLLYRPELPSCLSDPAARAAEPAIVFPNHSRPYAAGKEEGAIVAEILKQRLSPEDLAQAASHAGSWLWYGYLAAGKITLLTSQWKSGKTTLISVLLARMAKGGELAGLPVTAGRAAVITEEGPDNWDARCRKLQIGKHVSFFCRPFRAKPTMAQWRGLIDAMLDLKQREGLDLVVIDPLAVFLPGTNENTAGLMLECLLPLGDLTARGLSVLLVHHPRKGLSRPGQASRGSGALPSHVDILIEMNWYGQPDDEDRRRWLRAYSRQEETRRHLVLELVAAGDDYRAHDTLHEEAFAESWQVLSLVLEDASERLTQQQILDQWPEDFRKPDRTTISRELRRGVQQGLVRQEGAGRRHDPFRYWLPGKEEDFHPGPGASPEAIERWQQHWQAKSLQMLLDIASGSKAKPLAAAGVPAEPQPAAVVEAPVEVAAQATAQPCVSEPPPVIPCEGETVERSVELPVVGPTVPVVAVPESVRPTPPSEPVLPSLAAAPFVLSPIAVPTKEEAERAAEVARERQRVRRWRSG